MVKVVVDGMGGDYAPREVILGLREFFEEDKNTFVYLTGRESELKKYIDKYLPVKHGNLEVINAQDIVTMEDSLFSYLRKKRESSIRVGLELVKDGKAQGFYSAGNTGAVMVNSLMILGAVEGIDRPALGVVFPTNKGPSMIIDVGANVDCKAENLVQFAIMGIVYMEEMMKIRNPKVALMSIGEEDIKGNRLTKEAFKMLSGLNMNFIGNIEAHKIHDGDANVIVTDGFTGNVALKTAEGIIENLASYFKNKIMKNFFYKISLIILGRALKNMVKKLDYSEYGGALLLGVRGISVIGHGRSKAKAIKNGIKATKRLAEAEIHKKIEEKVKEVLKNVG